MCLGCLGGKSGAGSLSGGTRPLALVGPATALLALAALAVVFAASGSAAPTVAIVSPADGADTAFDFVGLSFNVSNFSVVPKFGQAPQPGEGHVHIFLDGAYLFFSANTTMSVRGLSAGAHTVRVELRENDHSALAVPVFGEVTFTAQGRAPSIVIVAPPGGTILFGNATEVTVSVANFTLAPSSIGAPAVTGQGHIHVLVDGFDRLEEGDLTAALDGLTPGDHTIKVELRNNDHSGLGAEVSAVVLVHVAARPSIRIASPASGLATSERSLNFTVALANFTLDTVNATAAKVAGHGHYHVFIDGTLSQMVASPTFTVANLALGAHTVRVVLAHNDHTQIPGENTSFEVTVTVGGPAATPPGFLPGFGGLEAMGAAGAALAALTLLAGAKRRGGQGR